MTVATYFFFRRPQVTIIESVGFYLVHQVCLHTWFVDVVGFIEVKAVGGAELVNCLLHRLETRRKSDVEMAIQVQASKVRSAKRP